ncbi:uncharacterized protein ACR2FA_009741 [Aphomia sociella]
MNANICANCHNKKPVNLTDNRLVTESCGHVKCMDCLLHEKSGCKACAKEKIPQAYKKEASIEDTVDNDNEVQVDEPIKESSEVQSIPYEELIKKKKPETSHINVEIDANGRCYVCTVCMKKFRARSQVAYHAYCNGQLKPYQCSDCNKSFATLSHFKYHMRVHRNERTYACDICGDSFFQMSKLQRHKLKHTREKKYVCSQCNKAYNNLTSLRKHGITHTEERPFTCSVCNYCFRDASNYRRHIAKHDGARSLAGRAVPRRTYQCPRCSLAFHSNKDMRRHTAVHTDSKPFRCKVCNRSFRRKDNLERHIRNTHPNYVTSTAVECDESALKQITIVNIQNNGQAISEEAYQSHEKTRLEILNPLPPLPKEVIQKHIMEINENVSQNNQEPADNVENKSLSIILEANIARQSVIVGKSTMDSKMSTAYHESEYIHKMQKANSMISQKNCSLPPINGNKILELERKTNSNNLGLGAPPRDRKELYKKILYEKPEIDGCDTNEEDTKMQQGTSPEMHWRRKMKLNNIAVDN